MNSPLLQLLVLAGIAIFLILRLKSVLGTRDGFEGPPRRGAPEPAKNDRRQEFEVIEGGPDLRRLLGLLRLCAAVFMFGHEALR